MALPDRSRYIYLYMPSSEDKQRYQRQADAAGIPLSRYLIGIIEDALADKENQVNRTSMAREFSDLKEENKRLKDELKLRDLVIERYTVDLKRIRDETFLDTSFTGKRNFDIELIQCINKKGPLHTQRLLEKLNIDPTDSDAISAISKQLSTLESYNLIELTPKGWTWAK